MATFLPGINSKSIASTTIIKSDKKQKRKKSITTEEDQFLEAPHIVIPDYKGLISEKKRKNVTKIPVTNDHEKSGCHGCVAMGIKHKSRRRRKTKTNRRTRTNKRKSRRYTNKYK